MKVGRFYRGGLAAAAVLVLQLAIPLDAAAGGTPTPVATDLDKRTKPADAPGGQAGGLSDSAVRVLMTYAFSIIPAETPGPDGKPVKVDKSDPNKFLIPNEDARRVIRAATRSAYAEVCELPDFQQANYKTFMRIEAAKNAWSPDQMLMIDALHTFSASYFAGGLKISVSEVDESAPANSAPDTVAISRGGAPASAPQQQAEADVIAAPTPKCPPEQKQKVMNAINAYVQAAQTSQAPAPAQKAAE